jgi:hypothetical protein
MGEHPHPQYGRQRLQLLPSGVLVRSTSETVLAKEGEDQDTFLKRLRDEYGVGPEDEVEVVYKAGKVQYAVIEWGPRQKRKA